MAFDPFPPPLDAPDGADRTGESRREPTWEGPLTLLGVTLGLLLMGIQLWLLTVAFNLYLAGEQGRVVVAAVISGLIFLGGWGMLLLLDRLSARRDDR
ncbi:MAG TPA: DUF6755 family protein [Thermomicrobiales bacterium]|nr:DUF6755 family protein [Thermomicrobiales bacterium]